jgi:hypothetical protein
MSFLDSLRSVRTRACSLSIATAAAALILAAPGAQAGVHRSSTTTTSTTTTSSSLFAPSSVWNARLASDAPLDSSSAARTAALVAEVKNEMQLKTGPWIEERSNSTPWYVVGNDQPKVPVTIDNNPVGANLLRNALSSGVPIPAGAQPAAGVDAHLTIYQPSTDTMWEFWHASLESDGWHADWGGAMQHVSTNPGYYSNLAWNGLGALDGWNWGSTASSLPMIGGTALISELKAGHIDHALAMNIPSPCQTWFSWPAQRTDGTSSDLSNCTLEGAHLRLDPKLDLSRLNLPPVTRMFAEAAQKYGIIVRDKTGEATTFFAEDPTPTGTDPYRAPGGFYGGKSPRDLMSQFPWAYLRLLKLTPCWTAPCLPPAT